jgi:hypothetical protein
VPEVERWVSGESGRREEERRDSLLPLSPLTHLSTSGTDL